MIRDEVANVGDVTSFVGRRSETTEITRLFDRARSVTLTGPGGVGKTRLALRIAATLDQRFPDGVVIIELAELRDAALLEDVLIEALGLHRRSTESAMNVLVEHLRARKILLVFDNCEHLAAGCAALFAVLLNRCTTLTLLATSRQALSVRGEHVYPVPPLQPTDAHRLFTDRAAAVVPGFTESGDDVAQVCERLDGLPLAIELAAARIKALTPAQLRDRLTMSMLTDHVADTTPRHRTLRDTIEWSFRLCAPSEQNLWALSTVFHGSFDLEAAEYVCGSAAGGPVLDLIEGLLDKSVLVRGDSNGIVRYRMLETLREYGREKLIGSGEESTALRRHRDWFDRLSAQADAEAVSPRQREWYGRLRDEHANIREAIAWSLTVPGEAGVAVRMAARSEEYWVMRGSLGEARDRLRRACAAARAEDVDGAAIAFALRTEAMFAIWQSDLVAARELLTEARALAGTDEILGAQIGHTEGFLELLLMNVDGAATLISDAVATFDRHARLPEPHLLFLDGVIKSYSSGLATARAAVQRNLDVCTGARAEFSLIGALFGQALVEVQFGDVEVALRAATTGLRMAEGFRFERVAMAAYLVEALAWIAHQQGDLTRAATVFGIAATGWQDLGASPDIAVNFIHQHRRDTTRKALGSKRFDELWLRGKDMSIAEAWKFMLEPRDEPGPLTRRENEIAALVAQGKSNRDIAAELVVSVRTVDTHIQHILDKLAAKSRVQIANWMNETRT
ncbi:LuxR C-terminal-related transcriptional regulator [Nocardia sp. NPDC058705]|uniref:LuxR C-terminal-related transcriptional regulator n=1 Tax=Nocardia sp. NPDC058705 TaxID=3346609 RepID=UPI00367EF00F